MDLVAGVRRRIVVMEHTNKRGESKVLPTCSLPLTGRRCVDLLITDLCVMEMDHSSNRFMLIELAPGISLEEVRAKTKAEFRVSPDLREVVLS